MERIRPETEVDRTQAALAALGATLPLWAMIDSSRSSSPMPAATTGVGRFSSIRQTVVFAAIFLGRSELVGRRLVVVALLVVAGSTLVGATR